MAPLAKEAQKEVRELKKERKNLRKERKELTGTDPSETQEVAGDE